MPVRSSVPGDNATVSPNPPCDPVSLETPEQGRARHCESQQFINAIRKELVGGYGFVPFIGAGFSVSAGIPIIEQLRNYLNRCICVALGAEDDVKEGQRRLWNPRTDQWPPFIDRKRPEPGKWQKLVYKRFKKERDHKKHGKPQIFQEGFGAMAEWRTSLHFLSRLVLDLPRQRKDTESHISLGLPRREVIDACFREVMRNKKPSLNHMMLGSLVGPLRIDLILSTNFDNLLEQAFEIKSIPLQPFEVQLGGNLPDLSAISRVRALVKLHGSLYSLRADYSLDAPPSVEDKDTFLEYLAGVKRKDRLQGREEPKGDLKPVKKPVDELMHNKSHLLILGVGAREVRSLAFIKHAWDNSDRLKLFWVCYSEDQWNAVETFRRKNLGNDNNGSRKIHLLRHAEIGLLLLHLYQSIRKTIPPNGAIFPTVTRIPLPPLPQDPAIEKPKSEEPDKPEPSGDESAAAKKAEEEALEKQKTYEENEAYKSELRDALKECQTPQRQYKLVVATAEQEAYGVTSACADIYRESERNNSCLWIDMNEISSADNLFEAFQEASYFKLGTVDWTPLYASKDNRPRNEEINRIGSSGNKPWIIFLNARERPGVNRLPCEKPNGWLDFEDVQTDAGTDQSNWMKPFLQLLEELCSQDKGRIAVVLLCRKSPSGLLDKLKALGAASVELKSTKGINSANRGEEAIAGQAVEWIGKAPEEQEARRHFLYFLVLMQRPRFFASAWDDCANPDPSPGHPPSHPGEFFDRKKENWLHELQDLGLLRWLDGGFIWLHSGAREAVRKKLGEKGNAAKSERHIHKKLAAWYQKAFAATGVSPAVFEAIDHYCFAAESVLKECIDDPEDKREAGANSRNLGRAALYVAAARRLLRDNSFLIQTQGHPRNSIRRLDFIRDFWHNPNRSLDGHALLEKLDGLLLKQESLKGAADKLLQNIYNLQCRSVEVARAIFREIGEDGEAYRRQRELQKRMVVHKPLSFTEVAPSIGIDRQSQMQVMVQQLAPAPHPRANRGAKPAKQSGRPQDLIRWWRWCAMLAIATRSFDRAEHSLYRGLSVAKQDPKIYEKPGSKLNLKLEAFTLESLDDVHVSDDGTRGGPPPWNLDPEDRHKMQLETLHSLEQSVYVLLLRDGTQSRLRLLQQLSQSADEEKHEDSEKWLKNARKFAERGLKLADQIQNNGAYEGSHDFEATWCKSRLLMHRGLLSHRLKEDKTASRHAMSYLGDAQACLSASDPSRLRADLALVELHRAEVRLQEASAIRLKIGSDSISFERWTYLRLNDPLETANEKVKQLKDLLQNEACPSPAEALQDGGDPTPANALRGVKSRATDALRYLDRAEPWLRERRRNVWWTTWFFERRLRAMALILWTSVVEDNAPIPFLGLEAAMRLTETEADVLLNDSVRMIRVDEYRLATVMLSYASCARALQVRLAIDEDTVELPERLKEMRNNLESATSELTNVQKRRNPGMTPSNAAKEEEKASQLARAKKDQTDKVAQKFITHAVELVAKVVASLKTRIP